MRCCLLLAAALPVALVQAGAPPPVTIYFADEALPWELAAEPPPTTVEPVQKPVSPPLSSPASSPVAVPAATVAQTEINTAFSTGLWSGNRRLDDSGGVVTPQVRVQIAHKLPQGASLVLDAEAWREQALDSGQSHDGVTIREAYLALRQGAISARIGPQIIHWGRADGLNPTDNLSAQDYTRLASDDAGQKLGVPSVNVQWRAGQVTAQAVWQPAFRASTLPLPAEPGLRYQPLAVTGERETLGAKLDRTGEALSWSLSYFQGPARRPTLVFAPALLGKGVVGLGYPAVKIAGADAEWLIGRWALRGELAYQRFDGSGDNALASRESFMQSALSVERDFGDASIFLLASYRQGFDVIHPDAVPEPLRFFARANAVVNEEIHPHLAGLGAGISYRTPDLRWQSLVELFAYPRLNGVTARPRLLYQWNDAVALWGGADWFSGDAEGPLGRLRDNRALFFGMRYSASPALP